MLIRKTSPPILRRDNMSDTPGTGSGEPKRLADDARLSEHELQRVIERAIQLDAARGGETTVAELRRVALELNISSTAINQALQELSAKAVVAPAAETADTTQEPVKSRFGSWWRPLGIGLASFALGAISASRDGDPFASLLVVIAASIALIIKHRRDGSRQEFHRDLLPLCGAMALGWLSTEHRHAADMTIVMSLDYIVTWAIGGF